MKKAIYCTLVVTFFLALFNWYEEGHSVGVFIATVGSVFGGFIATQFYIQIEDGKNLNAAPFAVVACISVTIGLVAYTYYAFNGSSLEKEGAQHMHLFKFPILHTIASVLMVGIAYIVSILIKVWVKCITKQLT